MRPIIPIFYEGPWRFILTGVLMLFTTAMISKASHTNIKPMQKNYMISAAVSGSVNVGVNIVFEFRKKKIRKLRAKKMMMMP